MIRYQFLEFLFKVADIKYYGHMIQQSYVEAITKLFDELSHKLVYLETA